MAHCARKPSMALPLDCAIENTCLSDAYSNKSWATIVAQGLFTLREINQTEREITRGSSLCSSLYALLCSLWPGLNGALNSKFSQSHYVTTFHIRKERRISTRTSRLTFYWL